MHICPDVRTDHDEIQRSENPRVSSRSHITRKLCTALDTTVIPPEIFTLIFLYACAVWPTKPNNHLRPLLTLSIVCSRWRNIVLSAPRLWSDMAFHIDPSTLTQSQTLIQWWYQKVKDAPFALRLRFSPNFSRLNRLILDEIIQGINAKNMRILGVDRIPWDWISSLSTFSNLETLEIPTGISDLPTTRSTLSLDHIPCLRRLELSTFGLSRIELRWTQMTHLSLRYLSSDICLALLAQCPNLVEFRNRSPVARDNASSPQIPPQTDGDIILSYLEHFTWSYRLYSLCISLFSRLRFSSLHTLHWHSLSWRTNAMSHSSGEMDALRVLAANFPASLSNMSLYSFASCPRQLHGFVFSMAPNLRTLQLVDCQHQFVASTLAFLRRYPNKGILQFESKNLLPALEELTIRNLQVIHGTEEETERYQVYLADSIYSVCQSWEYAEGRKGPLVQFVQAPGYWTTAMQRMYKLMKDEKFKFEIWENSERARSLMTVMEEEEAKEPESDDGLEYDELEEKRAKKYLKVVDTEDELSQELQYCQLESSVEFGKSVISGAGVNVNE